MAKDAEAAPIVLKAIEDGMTQKDAAQLAGINSDTFHTWMKEKPEFSEMVQHARENARLNAIARVEASLYRLATGWENEDVTTEYASEYNDQTKKMEPVIKKQRRVKRVYPAQTEAIKFFLTNQDPTKWKNRQEHDITNLDALKGLHIDLEGISDGDHIVESEDDIID